MTLPLLLAAATEPAANSGVMGGLRDTFEHFGVEWKYILIQLVSFLIVLGVLYKFAIKPTIAAMEERNGKIDSGLKYAEEMKAKLAATQEESAASAKRAQLEATRIIDEARKSAKDFLDKQTQETAAKANDIIAKAQQAIELEKKKMLAEARTEIARLVVVTTQRVLAQELTEVDRSRYNAAAARELTNA